MFRWFVRFAATALVGALLVWFWNRHNEDLLEEEFEDEIPLEFEVSAQDVMAPGTLDGNGAIDDPIAVAESAPVLAPAEPVAETAPAEEPRAAATESTPTAAAATEAPAADAVSTEAPTASVAEASVASNTPEAADTAADDSADEQELLLDSNAPTPAGAGDNVMMIKGIGPKYAEKLTEMGITTFGALLDTPIGTLAVAFPRVTDAELQSWMEQALELVTQPSEPA